MDRVKWSVLAALVFGVFAMVQVLRNEPNALVYAVLAVMWAVLSRGEK